MEPKFAVGQKVYRIEDREVTGATVVSIDAESADVYYQIDYDEGGTGCWPEDALSAGPPTPPEPEPKE